MDSSGLTIAFFGGTGFIGSYLVEECISAGHLPKLLVRRGSKEKLHKQERSYIVTGDLDDDKAVRNVLNGVDAVVYAVGIIREFPRRRITFDSLHVQAFQRVVDLAVEEGARRLLLLSANGAGPEGTSYQRSKYVAEEYLRSSSLDGVIIRPSIVFGDPWGKFEFTTMVRDTIVRPFLPAPLFFQGFDFRGAGKFKLAPVHVLNVATIAIRALTESGTGKTYDLCGPEIHTWQELISTVARAVGKKKMMIPVPVDAVSLAAAIFDQFAWFPVTRDQLTMLLEGNICNTKKVFERFDVDPIPFDERSLDYLVNNRIEKS